jgi:hypothetical protein
MCHGNADLKHLARETEARLARLPQGEGVPSVGLFARLRVWAAAKAGILAAPVRPVAELETRP